MCVNDLRLVFYKFSCVDIGQVGAGRRMGEVVLILFAPSFRSHVLITDKHIPARVAECLARQFIMGRAGCRARAPTFWHLDSFIC